MNASYSAVRLLDSSGRARGFTYNDDGAPYVCSQSYLQSIAEGYVKEHTTWTKVANAPALSTTESDIWGYAATQPDYIWPTTAMQMECTSSSANDVATVIKTGTSTGGSLTTLIDSGANFSSATAVAIGDLILLDKSGSSPEFGYVTSVDSSTQLTVSGGFSRGGSGSGRAYRIIDNSASTGAQVICLDYLDGTYTPKCELVELNGTNNVNTVNTNIFRINSTRVVAAGSSLKPAGNISVRNLAHSPVYSYVVAGVTRDRNSFYTVPVGYNLFVTSLVFSFGYAANQWNYGKMVTMATQYNPTGIDTNVFKSDGIFYPYTEAVCANSSTSYNIELPTRLMEKVDIKIRGVATSAGNASITMRGWLENMSV